MVHRKVLPTDNEFSLPKLQGSNIARLRYNMAIWIAAALLIAGALSAAIDIQIAQSVRSGNLPGDVSRILDVSEFFAHGFGVIVIATAIWMMLPDQKRFVPRLLACAFGAGLMANVFKSMIGRFRPVSYSKEFPDSIGDTFCGNFLAYVPQQDLGWSHPVQSFPSAHAATAFGLAICLGWLFPKGRYLFLFLAVLASAQRVVSLAHWTSDVFVGAAVGIVTAQLVLHSAFGNWVFSRIERRKSDLTETNAISRRRAA